MLSDEPIRYAIRKEKLFAGIRKPIKERDELIPRIVKVMDACKGAVDGPLTQIFRFDTPVDGFDSEIGFPVKSKINTDDVKTNRLRELHTYSTIHKGSIDEIKYSSRKLYNHMNVVGLSPELELTEIYHQFDPTNLDEATIEIQASFLAWPEVYREQVLRVLGNGLTNVIWAGGEEITPFTLVDERADWVANSINRLKNHSDMDQQFDILSRVALVRPSEDIERFKSIYMKTRELKSILDIQNKELASGPTGGFIDPPGFSDGKLHLSKVAYNREAYDQAANQDEVRKAYCFCTLVREASSPMIDPIFCYRAAGWARQFWEPILETEFKSCKITHSILKGDKFCAWDYVIED